MKRAIVHVMTHQVKQTARTDLIICPKCDAVFSLSQPEHGEKAVCQRCDSVLITPRRNAGLQIIALSVAIVILISAAAVFPFLSVDAVGVSNSVSILETALVFKDGPLAVLSLTTAALIIFIPLLRVVLCLYVIMPLFRDRAPARYASDAFRVAEALRPWSMAEVFAIGCAVALIKVSDLVHVSFGPAFWLFSVLVLLVVVQENVICRWSVWNALSRPKRS